jgi:hypothetical protein
MFQNSCRFAIYSLIAYYRLVVQSIVTEIKIMGSYRFNCALQTGNSTVDGASDNGNYDSPPSAEQAIEVVKKVRKLGENALPNGAHDAFNKAIDEVIAWLEAQAGVGYTPSGNYDITEARAEFTYKGTQYRVDIKAGGKTSGDPWFF